MVNPVIPKYVFVVDWQDTRTQLPFDHPNAVTPIDFDVNYGAQLFDFSRMVGLRGVIRIHDPQGLLDPLTHDKASTRYRELSVPHRFWMYCLDAQPPDTTARLHGFAVIDRRPDKDHAQLRLVSREFVRLRETVTVPRFNTYRVVTQPTISRRTTATRPQTEARVNSIIVDGFNEAGTEANVTVYFKDGDPDPVTSTPGFHVETIFVDWDGTTAGSRSFAVDASPHSFTIPVTPGGVYVARADIEQDLPKPAVTPQFTVPTLEDSQPTSISLRVTAAVDSVSIIASVVNPPEGNQQVTFAIGTQTRTSDVSLTGIATAQFSNLEPSTTYEVTATLNGTNVSRSAEFTTLATPTDPGGDPPPPVETADPQIEITVFSVQRVGGDTIRITGTVADTANAGGSVDNVLILQNYRQATSNIPIALPGARTNTAGEFSSDHRIPNPTDQPYVINAVAEGGSRQQSATFTFATTSTIAPTVSLDRITATATGATTAQLAAVVTNPTTAGTVWFRYRPSGTNVWTTISRSRAANQGIVTANLTALQPNTTYSVEGSITSGTQLFTRSATFTTTTVRTPMSISQAIATGVTETNATVTVRLSNVPAGSTPQVSFNVAGRTYSQLATQSPFDPGWSATFNVAGLTAATPYAFTVTATAGGDTDTATVSFTTSAPAAVTVRVATVRASWASITVRVQANNLLGTSIVTWDYRQTGTATWTQDTGSVLTTTPTGIATKTIDGLLPNTSYQIRAIVANVTDTATISTSCVPASEIAEVVDARAAAFDLRTKSATAAASTELAYLNVLNGLIRAGAAQAALDDAANTLNPTRFSTKTREAEAEIEALQQTIQASERLFSTARRDIEAANTAASTLQSSLSGLPQLPSTEVSGTANAVAVGIGTAAGAVAAFVVNLFVPGVPAPFVFTTVLGIVAGLISGSAGVLTRRDDAREAANQLARVVTDLEDAEVDTRNLRDSTRSLSFAAIRAVQDIDSNIAYLRREAC